MTPDLAGTPLLAVRNLEVVYGSSIRVLRGVSLDVPAGKVVALLGANGAGKTTLLRAVSGLLPHQSLAYLTPAEFTRRWHDQHQPRTS